MSTPLELLQSMAEVSTGMRALAQANDWDNLVVRERELASLRRALAALEPSGQGSQSLDAQQLAKKRALLEQILDDEAEVRRHVEPWMESTRKLLGDGARDRAVRAAYGAHGP